jgi:putative Mg2+ transporter-C (MgtC) family protein
VGQIWIGADTSCAIGVLVGVGLYGAAILLTALSALLMVWGSQLESRLPSRHAIGITLRFKAAVQPTQSLVSGWIQACGYELATGSISIKQEAAQAEWHFVAVALDRRRGWTLPELAAQLGNRPEIERLALAHARN